MVFVSGTWCQMGDVSLLAANEMLPKAEETSDFQIIGH